MSSNLTNEQLLRNRPQQDVSMSDSASFQLIPKDMRTSALLPAVSRLTQVLSTNVATSDLLTFADGLVGAILTRTSEFLTSPNVSYLPEPPHGSTRDLYRRVDGRYGPDDPICWPQPLNMKYPFYAAMPKKPTDGDWQALLMWLTLSDFNIDFTETAGSRRKGVLRKDLVDSLDAKLRRIKTRVKTFLDEFKQQQHQGFLDEHITTMEVCSKRISSTPSSPRDLQLGLSEVQRAYLVVKAFIDYERQHRTVQSTLVNPKVDKDRMGCFVWNDRDAMMIFKLGYPVFFIRPCTDFNRQVVLEVVPLTRAIFPAVETAPADPPYPSILTSQAGSDEKFAAIRRASIDCFTTISPFSNVHLPGAYTSSYNAGSNRIYSATASQPSTSTAASSLLPRASARPAHHNATRSPYKKRGQGRKIATNPPQAQRDLFADLPADDPYVSPDIAAWKGVNQTITRKPGSMRKKRLIAPDAGLFFGSAERQSDFFYQWDHMRRAWRQQILQGRSPQTVDVWRKALAYKFLKPLEAGVVMTPQLEAAEQARQLVESSIKHYDSSMPFLPVANGPFPHPRGRYLIRELCLVNFHSELIYLDALNDRSQPQPAANLTVDDLDTQRSSHRRTRRNLIDGAFGGHDAVPDPQMNMGITAATWSERYTALKSFWAVLDTWPGTKPNIWRRGQDMDLTRLEDVGQTWERALTEFYVQQAYDVFGYPPAIPRRI